MRGTHRIIVQNKRIRYDFEIRRNITIIRGDSATELYHLYHAEKHGQPGRPEKVIVEDSNSGVQFFQGICERSGGVSCISSQGKSNIFSVVAGQLGEKILAVAEGVRLY